MSTKKMLLILGINFFVIVIILAAGFMVLWNKVSSLDPEKKKEEALKKAAAKKAEMQAAKALPKEMGPIFALDPFIVNLGDMGGKRYLRTAIAIELNAKDQKELKEEIDKRMPQIKDIILTTLPTRKFDDIQTVEGKVILRDEIIGKLNKLLKKGKIANLYFTEFVVQ